MWWLKKKKKKKWKAPLFFIPVLYAFECSSDEEVCEQ
jgi:hypothetical protein